MNDTIKLVEIKNNRRQIIYKLKPSKYYISSMSGEVQTGILWSTKVKRLEKNERLIKLRKIEYNDRFVKIRKLFKKYCETSS